MEAVPPSGEEIANILFLSLKVASPQVSISSTSGSARHAARSCLNVMEKRPQPQR